MPVHVTKSGSGYAIREKSGKVKGRSDSKRKAMISAFYRNQAIRKKRSRA